MEKMAKSCKRSIRRHHKERMKNKAHWVYPHDQQAYKLADNLQFCQCLFCKNRRMWCDTKQEYKNHLDYIEQINEMDYTTDIEYKKRKPRRFDRW